MDESTGRLTMTALAALGGLSLFGAEALSFDLGTQGGGHGIHDRATLLRTRSTCSAETPLPVDFFPTKLLDNPTGYLPESEAVSSLVKDAAAHVRALAMIPIDEEAEAVVDELFAQAERRSGRRSLR